MHAFRMAKANPSLTLQNASSGSTDLCIRGRVSEIRRTKLLDMAQVMLLAIKATGTHESSLILKMTLFNKSF